VPSRKAVQMENFGKRQTLVINFTLKIAGGIVGKENI
jgi:hypothetical protein